MGSLGLPLLGVNSGVNHLFKNLCDGATEQPQNIGKLIKLTHDVMSYSVFLIQTKTWEHILRRGQGSPDTFKVPLPMGYPSDETKFYSSLFYAERTNL